jgi:hypothetical protein
VYVPINSLFSGYRWDIPSDVRCQLKSRQRDIAETALINEKSAVFPISSVLLHVEQIFKMLFINVICLLVVFINSLR